MPASATSLLVRMSSATRVKVILGELLQGVRFKIDKAPEQFEVTSDAGAGIAALVRPTKPTIVQQTLRVESWAALRAERLPEILSQIGPQFTYWSSIAPLGSIPSPYSAELLVVAGAFASHVVQAAKYRMPVPRPEEYSARIQPPIEAPAFFAYPSGHATGAFSAARLLDTLLSPGSGADLPLRDPAEQLDETRAQLYRQAERIATNRVVAGIHYPVDSAAGCALGLSLAEYLVARARGGAWTERTFDGSGFGALDFDPRPFVAGGTLRDGMLASRPSTPLVVKATSDIIPPNDLVSESPLSWLWRQARREWHEAGRA